MSYKDILIQRRGQLYNCLLRCSLTDLSLDSDVGNAALKYNEKELVKQGISVVDLRYPRTDNSILLASSFVGLFWLTPDYSKVVDIAGVKEFTPGDVMAKNELYPDGNHVEYRQHDYRVIPRGRVSLVDGNIIINVGLQCPDEAFPLIVKAFGLENYKDSNLFIKKLFHWDPK